MSSYIRSDDGAEMIEIGPHSFVNRAVLSLLGRVYANLGNHNAGSSGSLPGVLPSHEVKA